MTRDNSADSLPRCDVIFVSNALANGGAARVLTLLANSFVGRGASVGMLCFNPYQGEYVLSPQVSKVYGPVGSSAVAKLKRILWLRRIARQNPHAVIIAFEYFVNMQMLIACLGLSNRVIVSERNDPAREGSGFPVGFARTMLYRFADLLVCQTDDAAEFFSDKIKKRVILNPVKPNLPEPTEGERSHTVVTFGRLEKQKNLPMLVRAFAEFLPTHPEYSLEIYGDGAEEQSLRDLIASLSLTERVMVLAGRSDIHDVVRDAAMFILPSDYEGLSNSMLEAMAMGIPVICTDCPCGGARMVIEDGVNGLLVPVGATESLTTAMSKIADEAALAAELGANASTLRASLSVDVIVNEWVRAAELSQFEGAERNSV